MASKSDGIDMGFIQKVLFVIAAIALSLLAFKLLGLWLMIFGAIVIATVLRALAEPLIRFTPMNDTIAVLTVLVVVLGVMSATFYLFGRDLVEQAQTLTTQIPQAWAALQGKLQATPIGQSVQAQIDALGHQAGGVVDKLPMIAGNILSSVANVFVALIAGIILAINPGRYRDGIVFLFPSDHHEKIRDGLNAAGGALRLWFIGQFISMIIVGTLTGIGLSLIHLPSALALGMIAGLAQFVPIVGPVVSAGPGLLLALTTSWQVFIWALIVYVGVSHLESNFITPMVQKRIASIPIVVTLFAVVGFAGLLGPMGVIYAMPMTVILYTLIRRLYDGPDAPPPLRPSEALFGGLKHLFQKR